MKKVLFFLVLTLFCNAQINLWADYYGSGDYSKISFPSKNIGYISVINQQNHSNYKTLSKPPYIPILLLYSLIAIF